MRLNGIFIVPTGIGAEIGGHAGDATPHAKLIASLCDNLIVHPNVVNASDINEMTDNMWYVEGSMLDRFAAGEFGLEKRAGTNKILIAVNELTNSIINSANAAKAVLGADISIVVLQEPLVMESMIYNNYATGRIENLPQLYSQLAKYDFDVLVVNTPITTSDEMVLDYLGSNGGVNPWGGVEAKLSRIASKKLGKPVIHAPVENSPAFAAFNDIVDPRKAAEMVSISYIHCCLKGAYLSPVMSDGNRALQIQDIDFLLSPVGVNGNIHQECEKVGVTCVYVEENTTTLDHPISDNAITVNNYMEACGVIAAIKAHVSLQSLKRPISPVETYD